MSLGILAFEMTCPCYAVFKVTTIAGIIAMTPNTLPKANIVPPTTAAAKTNTSLISLIFNYT